MAREAGWGESQVHRHGPNRFVAGWFVLMAALLFVTCPAFGGDVVEYDVSDAATTVTVENDPGTLGGDRVVTDDGYPPLVVTAIESLTVYSGTGDETITLKGLDSATALRTIHLSGDTKLGGDTGDDAFVITPSTVATVYLTGGAGTDTLTVVAPPLLATDTGTYVEVCGHERIYYDGFESVTVQAPAALDVLSVAASGAGSITVADSPGMPLTNRIEEAGVVAIDFTGVQTLNLGLNPAGNTVDLRTLDVCAWLSTINLTGAGGDDVFLVDPALLAEVHVEGGAGTDSLTVDALGHTAFDRGTHIEVAGYQNVYYSGIESVVLTNVAPGTIVVRKQTPDGLGSGFVFTDDIAAPNTFTLSAGETKTFNAVAPGTYTATELDPAPSYQLTAITVDDAASAVPSTVDVGARTATIHLESGETVTVAFVNALEAFDTGDVDGDGEITLFDVRLCLQIAQGIGSASAAACAAADVNGDGTVDETDSEILAEYVLHLRLTLP